MNSIFTIERRKDFPETYSRFLWDLQSFKITASTGFRYTIFDYLNYCIRYWPYRYGAVSISDYVDKINVDFSDPQEDKDRLLALELFINLLFYAPRQDQSDDVDRMFNITPRRHEAQIESERLIENAKYILEQCCNMKIREENHEECPKYYVTKRNPHVDVAVNAVPELMDVLLGYFDVRNQDNLAQKKVMLETIYNYMEPHRKAYKAFSCSAVSEEFFTAINTLGIRHNTKSQVRLPEKKANDIYDKLFMMAVYVLQTEEVNLFKKQLKELREIKNNPTEATSCSEQETHTVSD